jgi:hypothetical protein
MMHWVNCIRLLTIIFVLIGGSGIGVDSDATRRRTLLDGIPVVQGQILPSRTATVSAMHHASTISTAHQSSTSHQRTTESFTTAPTFKYPIRIDCGTSTYIDPITKVRWRGGSSYIQNRSLSRNYQIANAETITIPSTLQTPNVTTSEKSKNRIMMMTITAAPPRVYRTHKYYRTPSTKKENSTTGFQFNIPVESSFRNKSDVIVKQNMESDIVRTYTVRLHFAETVRRWIVHPPLV